MNPNRPISEVMSTRLVTVEPQTTARTIKDIFEQHEFHHLPVVEGSTWSEKEYEVFKAEDLMTDHPP